MGVFDPELIVDSGRFTVRSPIGLSRPGTVAGAADLRHRRPRAGRREVHVSRGLRGALPAGGAQPARGFRKSGWRPAIWLEHAGLRRWLDGTRAAAEGSSLERLRLAPRTPPLFVVGPPRFDTTASFLTLVNRFRLAFFPTWRSRCDPACPRNRGNLRAQLPDPGPADRIALRPGAPQRGRDRRRCAGRRGGPAAVLGAALPSGSPALATHPARQERPSAERPTWPLRGGSA